MVPGFMRTPSKCIVSPTELILLEVLGLGLYGSFAIYLGPMLTDIVLECRFKRLSITQF